MIRKWTYRIIIVFVFLLCLVFGYGQYKYHKNASGDVEPEIADASFSGVFGEVRLLLIQVLLKSILKNEDEALKDKKDAIELVGLENAAGLICFQKGQWDEALAFFKNALEHLEKSGQRNYPGYSVILGNRIMAENNILAGEQGKIDRHLLRIKEAAKQWGNTSFLTFIASLELAEEYKKQDREDEYWGVYSTLGEICTANINNKELLNACLKVFINLSTYSRLSNNYDKTKEAIDSLSAIVEDMRLSPESKIVGLRQLTRLSYELGDYDESLLFSKRRVDLIDRYIDCDSVKCVGAYNDLGRLYRMTGEYGDSIRAFEKSIEVAHSLHGDSSEEALIAHLGAGMAYWSLGQISEARRHIQEGIKISDKNTDKLGELRSLAYSNMGYQFLGSDNDIAEYYFNKAIEYNLYPEKSKDPTAILDSLLGLVNAALLQHRPDKVSTIVSQADQIIDSAQGLAEALSYKQVMTVFSSVAAYMLGEKDSARKKIVDAISRYGITFDSLEALAAQLHDANPAAEIAILKYAVNLTQQSIVKNFDYIGFTGIRNVLKNKSYRYRALAKRLIADGKPSEADMVIRMLKLVEVADYSSIPMVERQEIIIGYDSYEKKLVSKLENLGARLSNQRSALFQRGLLGKNPSQLEGHVTSDPLYKANLGDQQRMAAFIDDLFAPISKLTNSKPALSLASTKLLNKPKAGSLFLTVFIQDDVLYEIAESFKGTQVVKSDVNEKEVIQLISSMTHSARSVSSEFNDISERLYQILIGPLAKILDLVQPKRIILVLDGSLRYIPFSALFDGNRYLIERYSFSVAPIGNVLDESANYVNGPWKISLMGVSKPSNNLPALPGVRDEIYGIADNGNVGNLISDIRLDGDFTRQALHDAGRNGFKVMHIASHYIYSPGTEDNSYLSLGNNEKLSLREIRQGDFWFRGVDLLTLSACETGILGGLTSDGREIDSLSSVAINKGARSLISTLWPVGDKSTAQLMKKFYNLRFVKNIPKDDALRLAQLDLLYGRHEQKSSDNSVIGMDIQLRGSGALDADPNKPYSHPFYWAPFSLIGNWQ